MKEKKSELGDRQSRLLCVKRSEAETGLKGRAQRGHSSPFFSFPPSLSSASTFLIKERRKNEEEPEKIERVRLDSTI